MVGKHGQQFLVGIMLFIVFIIMALALAPPLKSFGDSARAPSNDSQIGLDCGNSSISNFDKANCVAVDIYTPYYVGALIFIGGAILAYKILI